MTNRLPGCNDERARATGHYDATLRVDGQRRHSVQRRAGVGRRDAALRSPSRARRDTPCPSRRVRARPATTMVPSGDNAPSSAAVTSPSLRLVSHTPP